MTMKKFAHISLLLMILTTIPYTLSAKPLLYVPTGTANDIVIIDLSTDEIVGRIGELDNAHALASSQKSEYLVAGSMSPVEPDSSVKASKPQAVTEEEHQKHHAGDIAKSGEAAASSYISIIHPQHAHVIRRILVHGLTHHTAVSPDGKTAIAVHPATGDISIIDPVEFVVTKTLKTGGLPNYAVFSPSGHRLYISNSQSSTISEINTDDWTTIRDIRVGKRPEHMAITADASKLFVANVGDGTATVVDLPQGVLTKTYQTGASPHGIDVSEDGRWMFVSSMGDGKLSRIDLANNEIKSVNLQPAPYHLEYVDKVKKLYVSSRKESIIWVLNPETLILINTIDIGKGVAHQMVIRDE